LSGAVRLHLGAVFEVIFAAREPEARLAGERRVNVRVLEVWIDADVDRAGKARLDEQRYELVAGLGGVDLGEIGLERRGAGGFDRTGVHEARIIIADLLAELVTVGIGGELLDDLADVLLGLVGEGHERTG
jgi:hypothetical protein